MQLDLPTQKSDVISECSLTEDLSFVFTQPFILYCSRKAEAKCTMILDIVCTCVEAYVLFSGSESYCFSRVFIKHLSLDYITNLQTENHRHFYCLCWKKSTLKLICLFPFRPDYVHVSLTYALSM